jgi:hypothetical protein
MSVLMTTDGCPDVDPGQTPWNHAERPALAVSPVMANGQLSSHRHSRKPNLDSKMFLIRRFYLLLQLGSFLPRPFPFFFPFFLVTLSPELCTLRC